MVVGRYGENLAYVLPHATGVSKLERGSVIRRNQHTEDGNVTVTVLKR